MGGGKLIPIAPVPEPSTLFLLASGILSMIIVFKKNSVKSVDATPITTPIELQKRHRKFIIGGLK
jgi:hypothetical protein